MPDRNKVIKGLECCTKFSDRTCKDCPYQPAIVKIDYLCYNNLMLDALELLKGQEPITNTSISIAIECLLHPQDADDSDMVKAIDTAVHAMRSLKTQKPRVLTLEEVEDALDTVVWVDRQQVENSSDEYALITAYSRKLGYVDLKFIDGGWGRFTYAWYGKTWRCWDKRPYEEERKAVKWDD